MPHPGAYGVTLYDKDEVLEFEVPPAPLEQFTCRLLVREFGAYRRCRKHAEFYMPTPWGSQIMVCFTHMNAKRVRIEA